ncbi:MAG: phosphoribosylanthranilate isomerase [Ardenticatenia bacterium]|nr:phosphoribosylanthranilate isomerase [Ardenticatenia bacterium]
MTRVKICGITNLEDAMAAAAAGADFVGFVFYDKSPRFIAPDRAATIVRALRDELGSSCPCTVGIFVDAPVDEVRALLDGVGLDLAQLHGSEPPAEVRQLRPRAYKAIRPQAREDAEAALALYYDTMPQDENAPQLLMDSYHPWLIGGTGILADVAVAMLVARRVRLMLAGGLTPESVGEIIRRVRPWGVDVSSGVERTKGIKDHARIRAFVEAVRRADATRGPEEAP